MFFASDWITRLSFSLTGVTSGGVVGTSSTGLPGHKEADVEALYKLTVKKFLAGRLAGLCNHSANLEEKVRKEQEDI